MTLLAPGRRIDANGYVQVRVRSGGSPGSPYRREHLLVAEKHAGIRVSWPRVIHHVNGIKTDNRPQNLVVCENQGYHILLERRTRALKECGHADWLRCHHCGQHGPDVIAYPLASDRPTHFVHRACGNAYNKARKLKKSLEEA